MQQSGAITGGILGENFPRSRNDYVNVGFPDRFDPFQTMNAVNLRHSRTYRSMAERVLPGAIPLERIWAVRLPFFGSRAAFFCQTGGGFWTRARCRAEWQENPRLSGVAAGGVREAMQSLLHSVRRIRLQKVTENRAIYRLSWRACPYGPPCLSAKRAVTGRGSRTGNTSHRPTACRYEWRRFWLDRTHTLDANAKDHSCAYLQCHADTRPQKTSAGSRSAHSERDGSNVPSVSNHRDFFARAAGGCKGCVLLD